MQYTKKYVDNKDINTAFNLVVALFATTIFLH